MENNSTIKRPNPRDVQTIGIVGTGVIGGGWALHYLRQGLQVVVYDPAESAEAETRRMVDETWPTMEKLGLKPGASPDNIEFADSIEVLGERVQVVQENVPEN
ncbi:MAG: L-carnitine dehydrogenase, partial [Proteobacteria bacterium]|nr:L-carnitine dehydrogenase [Pseudomonadota bacterium]